MLVATNPQGEATLDLRVRITDSLDVSRGKIINATVTFKVYDTLVFTNPVHEETLIISTANLVDQQNAIVYSNYTYTLESDDDYKILYITAVVDGYYTGALEAVPATVYRPDGDHISGGGFIIPTNSAGTHASDPGTHANYGFTFKYHKNGTLQGELNLVVRRVENNVNKTYQFKSTQVLNMALNVKNANEKTASFSAVVTRSDVTNPSSPIDIKPGLRINGNMIDRGNPGNTDEIAFTVWDGSTLVYSSNWQGGKTALQYIAGGNLVVHKGSNIYSDIVEYFQAEESQDYGLTVYPNPATDRAVFRFVPQSDGPVRLELFDIRGALVGVLYDSQVSAGLLYEIEYLPTRSHSQMLIYRMAAGDRVITGKLILQQ